MEAWSPGKGQDMGLRVKILNYVSAQVQIQYYVQYESKPSFRVGKYCLRWG